jgi:hypothetical protein
VSPLTPEEMLKTVKNFFNRDDCEKFYKLGKTLGQGSFATVCGASRYYCCEDWTGGLLVHYVCAPAEGV